MDSSSFAVCVRSGFDADEVFGPKSETRPTPASPSKKTKASAADALAREFQRELVRLLPELRGRAMRLVGDASRADDLVQDTFERALRFQGQYQAGSNLRAWAGQVLFSVFVTRYRRIRRERNALRVLAQDPCAWTTPEPLAPQVPVGLSSRTEAKLAALPEAFRDGVVLVDLAEHSYREAADALGVPVGTVMSRLHRGRKLLAAELAA